MLQILDTLLAALILLNSTEEALATSSLAHAFIPLLSHFNPAEPTPKAAPPAELKKAAAGAFAAFTIASSAFHVNVPAAGAADFQMAPNPTFITSSSNVLAVETETRQGLYRDYEVDVESQKYDDARSTFKDAKETKSKKGA